MIHTLFFSRLRPDLDARGAAEYTRDVEEVLLRARDEHPGFVDLMRYTGETGQRLTVVRFEDGDAQTRWRRDPTHVAAQRRARELYYDSYRIVVLQELRARTWTRGG